MVKKIVRILLVLLVPVLFLFDMVIYTSTKSGCLTCGEFTDYFKSNASLTFLVTSQAVGVFRKK